MVRQQEEARLCGRRVLSYDEWEKEELDKKKEMEKKKKDEEHLERKKKEFQIVTARKSALQQQIAEREQEEERGRQAERILRQEIAQAPTSTSSRATKSGLSQMEVAMMQEQMKALPPAPKKLEKAEKPKKTEKPEQDQEAPKQPKVILKEAEHKMPPGGHGLHGGQAPLPGPPPMWFQGIFQSSPRPMLRPPLQQQMQQIQIQLQPQHRSLDLGPTRQPNPEEAAAASRWLDRHQGGPTLDLTVFRHPPGPAYFPGEPLSGLQEDQPASQAAPAEPAAPHGMHFATFSSWSTR